jgi:hypothetical protein
MDHQTATKLQATERYLLGELSPGERDEFEEHFFTCPECAEDVRAALELRANARALFREEGLRIPEPQADRKRRWFEWLRPRPALAFSVILNLALLFAVGVQVTRLGRLEDATRAQFYPSLYVPAAARSAPSAKDIPSGTRLVGFYFDLKEQERSYPQYVYRVEDAAGKTVRSGNLGAPVASTPEANLAVPTGGLKPGAYTFIFSGVGNGRETELRRMQFRIQN